MTVSAQDFMSFANPFIDKKDASEIEYRSAISRAYYAVYHSALENANRLKIPEFEGSTHETIAYRFQQHGEKSLAYIIRDLHKHRCIADYECHATITSRDVSKILEKCQSTINRLSSL